MTEQEQRAAFEAAIKAIPYDEAAHLVYSDWLEERGEDDLALRMRRYVPSRKWLREFSCKHHCYGEYHDFEEERRTGKDRYGERVEDVDKMMEEFYRDFMKILEGHCAGGPHSFGFDLPDPFPYSDELWEHFEVVTGKRPKDEWRNQMPNDFRCAC